MNDLDQQLAQQAPTSTNDTSMLYELPALTVDGIPTQLDKMTQVTITRGQSGLTKIGTHRRRTWTVQSY